MDEENCETRSSTGQSHESLELKRAGCVQLLGLMPPPPNIEYDKKLRLKKSLKELQTEIKKALRSVHLENDERLKVPNAEDHWCLSKGQCHFFIYREEKCALRKFHQLIDILKDLQGHLLESSLNEAKNWVKMLRVSHHKKYLRAIARKFEIKQQESEDNSSDLVSFENESQTSDMDADSNQQDPYSLEFDRIYEELRQTRRQRLENGLEEEAYSFSEDD